jgi:predicted amidohydrolase
MKIGVAQTKPFTGDIDGNIQSHKELIALAVARGAEIIIFPELSITGYEPALAKDLATTPNDSRFNEFQQLSDRHKIIIGIGAPTKTEEGICITMLLFHPGQPRQTYSKKYLHADEEPFFISGKNINACINNYPNIALAICYELSVPQHAEAAFDNGANIYIASVAKTPAGVDKAIHTLAETAKRYCMTVLMANSIGPAGGGAGGGRTSVWNNNGTLVAQLDDENEGILVFDTALNILSGHTLKTQS